MLVDPTSPDAVNARINVVPMNFRSEFVPDKTKPGEFKEIHKVDLVKKGSRGESTVWSLNALKKESFLWDFIEPYYNYWLKGQEDPVDGIPLDVLSFLPPAVVGHLKNIHIRTAEDLAACNEGALEKIGMGARGWREKARAYLAEKDDAVLAEANVKLAKENELLRADMEELKEQVNSLVAGKPKRGRPRKIK